MFTSELIRSIAETYATRMVLVVVGIVATMIIARILGPDGRGEFAAAMTLGSMGVHFGNLGLHASNTYYVARDPRLVAGLLANSLVVSFGLMGALAALAAGVFVLWPQVAPVHGTMLALALAWVPFGLACLLAQNLLIGVREIRVYNQIELGSRLIGLALVGAVIVAGAVSPESIFFVSFLALILALMWSVWRLRPHCVRFTSPSWSLFQENVRYGLNAYAANVFGSIVLRVDLLMIQYMRTQTETGYYSVAAAMAELLLMLPMVAGTILFPRLSGIADPVEKWRLASRTAAGVGGVVGAFAIASTFLAAPAVRTIFGSSFLPAVPAFVWLTPGIAFLAVGSIFQNYIGSTGFARGMIYGPFLAASTNVLVNLYLIDRFGIVGAAWSSTACYGLQALVGWLVARRCLLRDAGPMGLSSRVRTKRCRSI